MDLKDAGSSHTAVGPWIESIVSSSVQPSLVQLIGTIRNASLLF